MRRVVFRGFLLCSLALTALVGCDDDDDDGDGIVDDEVAELRVVHASPDAPPVDVYIAGSDDPVIEDLAYGEASEYLELDAGDYVFEIRAADAPPSEPPAFTTDELALSDDARVTAIATGLLGSTDPSDAFRVIPLVEGFDRPGSDQAIVRIVHASPDAPTVAIDVGDDGTIEIDELARFEATGAAGVPLPAGEPIVVAILAGDPLMQVTSFTTPALPAGAELFVIATGNLAEPPREETGFGLLVVGPTGAIGQVAQDPTLYALHASPDAPAVDVVLGDTVVVEALAFGELSGPLQVSPGSYELDLNVAGTETTAATISAPELAAGQRYLAVVTGFAGGDPPLQAILAVDELAIDPDSARLAAIHAAPDAPAVDIGVAVEERIAGAPAIADLAFTEVTDPTGLELPPETVTLGVAPAGEAETVATFDVPLEAGMRGWAVAAGALSPEMGEAPFRLLAVIASETPWQVVEILPND